MSCPSSTDYKCLSWDGTGVKADVEPNTVASTYMPPSTDGLRYDSPLIKLTFTLPVHIGEIHRYMLPLQPVG